MTIKFLKEISKVKLTNREQIVYDDIIALSELTDDQTVKIAHISVLTSIKGRTLSGIISSLQRRNLISTDGTIIKLTQVIQNEI